MQFRKNALKEIIVVRLDRGDEIISSILRVSRENNITAAAFFGIGAVDYAKIGVFSEGEYKTRIVEGDLEITSLIGNVTMKEQEPFVHAHITLADTNNTYAGHLLEARVSVTVELFLLVLEKEISRIRDQRTGLYLLDLK